MKLENLSLKDIGRIDDIDVRCIWFKDRDSTGKVIYYIDRYTAYTEEKGIVGECPYFIEYDYMNFNDFYFVYYKISDDSFLKLSTDEAEDIQVDMMLYEYITAGIDPEEALKIISL